MNGWYLETADGFPIHTKYLWFSSSVATDIQTMSDIHSAYWVAPASYLGDRVMTVYSSEPSLGLLCDCVINIDRGSGSKYQEDV